MSCSGIRSRYRAAGNERCVARPLAISAATALAGSDMALCLCTCTLQNKNPDTQSQLNERFIAIPLRFTKRITYGSLQFSHRGPWPPAPGYFLCSCSKHQARHAMYSKVYLNAPFSANAEIKAGGARFDAGCRCWYVDNPAAAKRCATYIPEGTATEWPERDWRYYSYEDRAVARAAGCQFDKDWRCWYMPEGMGPSYSEQFP